jgi:hypothetical protein
MTQPETPVSRGGNSFSGRGRRGQAWGPFGFAQGRLFDSAGVSLRGTLAPLRMTQGKRRRACGDPGRDSRQSWWELLFGPVAARSGMGPFGFAQGRLFDSARISLRGTLAPLRVTQGKRRRACGDQGRDSRQLWWKLLFGAVTARSGTENYGNDAVKRAKAGPSLRSG